MKTTSSDYIKEIKAEIKSINKAMKRIEEAEKFNVRQEIAGTTTRHRMRLKMRT